MFDGQCSDASELISVKIADKPLVSVQTKTAVYVHSLKLSVQSSLPLTILGKNSNHNVDQLTYVVPPDHSIVGVFGKFSFNCISRLGFILVENS